MLGRRRAIFLASGVSMIGAILMCTSYSLAQLVVARLVLGFGTGGYTATIPVWQSELSLARHRGSHVVTEGIFIGAGTTIALWIDFGFYYVTSSASWRVPLVLQVVLSVMVMSFIFTLPESPRWLIKKGRLEEARHILSALESVPMDSPKINADINEIVMTLDIAKTGSLLKIFKMGPQRLFQRVLLGMSCLMFLQLCGVNLISFYSTTIFENDLGFGATKSRILAACMQVMQPCGAFVCFFTIDAFGRRRLMTFAAAGMAICMAGLAGCTSQATNMHALNAAVFFLFAFNFIFPIGFLGIPFLYASEVSPLHLRAIISGLAVATTWIFNFLIAEITPVGFDTLGYRYYIIFAVLNAFLILPTVYFLFPETNGRSLEEMELIFAKSNSVFDTVKIANNLPKMHLADNATQDPEKLARLTAPPTTKARLSHVEDA